MALFCLEPVGDSPLHSWRCCYGQAYSLVHSTLPIGSSRDPWEPPEQLTRYSVKNLAWYVPPLSRLRRFLNFGPDLRIRGEWLLLTRPRDRSHPQQTIRDEQWSPAVAGSKWLSRNRTSKSGLQTHNFDYHPCWRRHCSHVRSLTSLSFLVSNLNLPADQLFPSANALSGRSLSPELKPPCASTRLPYTVNPSTSPQNWSCPWRPAGNHSRRSTSSEYPCGLVRRLTDQYGRSPH